jgi:hypothetical protein
MRYKLQCKACGATCWVNGDYEPDTNAVNLDDSHVYEWEPESNCDHEDFDSVDSEPRDDDDEF